MAVEHGNCGDVEEPALAYAKTKEAESSETEKSPTTLREKIIRHNIMVEPTLAFCIIPCLLAMLATQNLNLVKACPVNLGYPTEVCDALSARNTANYTKEELKVQQLVAGMAGWKSFLQSSVPAFMILFWGSWTDRRGRRRPCMLLPIVGDFLTSVGLIICTYFLYELRMEVVGLTEAIFSALTGGWYTMFMAIFSYIGDITCVKDRTLRIGIVNVWWSIGIPIGLALTCQRRSPQEFYGVFALSASMYFIGFWYTVFFIKECPPKESEESKVAAAANALAVADGSREPGPIGRRFGGIRDFFDSKHIKETFRVASQEGQRDRRKRVILLMVVVMVVIGPMHGEMNVLYLFMRYRFNWDEVEYSIFSTHSMVMNLIGTTLSVGLFSHVLKIDDAMIGIMSCMSKILAGFVYAFATTDWMVRYTSVRNLATSEVNTKEQKTEEKEMVIRN